MPIDPPIDEFKLRDELEINGARIDSAALMSLFLMIFYPNPSRWYRFEKQGDAILVETRIEEPPTIVRAN